MQHQFPLIGIVTCFDRNKSTDFIRQDYSSAILKAGGIPVLIPTISKTEYVNQLVQNLDGLLLIGHDSDIDPARYGQPPHLQLDDVTPQRDAIDQLLLCAAESKSIPVLGICFGLQSINIWRGGTLFQDIPSQIENSIQHRQKGDRNRLSHSIKIEPESLLSKLANSSTMYVNSTHHQAVDKIGIDMKSIAWASDGIIEAIINERPNQFILGVQWHPEVNNEKNSFSQSIFQHFIQQARQNIIKS